MTRVKCVLCQKKLRVHERRPVNKHIGKYLRKTFLLDSTQSDFICGKCSRPAYRQHIIYNNIEEIKNWMRPSDIFVVDRGFRDSVKLLEDLGIQAEIPAFMTRSEKQMTSEAANTSRLVTKVRWVVEAANARIKRWKYLNFVLPSNQIPFIGDYVRIVCAISNKYLPSINERRSIDCKQNVRSGVQNKCTSDLC